MSQTVDQREPADGAPVALRDDPQAAIQAKPIGLIGLDRQGIDAASRLTAAGQRVLACDPDAGRRAVYAALDGAEITASPAEVGRRCSIVLLLLQLGEDNTMLHGALADALPPGGLIIDMGPGLPGQTRRLSADLAAKGLRLVDAQRLDTPLLILLGGSDADVALAEPILTLLAQCLHTGPVGSAQALSALIAELDPPPDLARIRGLMAG